MRLTVNTHSTSYVYAGYKFGPYSNLPSEFISASKQVMKFAGHYVDMSSGVYNWSGFEYAVEHYNGSDLSLNSDDSSTISQQNSDVNAMVNKIVNVYHDKYSSPVDVSQLTALVQQTFSSTPNSSWSYSALFAFDKSSPSQFQGLITLLTVTAQAGNYEAKINAIQVDVKKGFVSPVS